MATVATATLSVACLVLHLALLGLAPLASGIEAAGRALGSGRLPTSPLRPYLDLETEWRRGVVASTSRLRSASAAAALGSTFCAALLVPGVATGLPFAPMDDLVLVGFLLIVARLARLVASSDGPAADYTVDLGRTLPVLVLMIPAFLFAALLASLLGGSTRLDAAILAAPDASGASRALLAISFALIALADRDARDHSSGGERGRVAASLAIERSLRFLVLLTLVADFLPPAIAAGQGGLVPLVLAPPVFLAKLGLLAFASGASLTVRARLGASTLLGTASLLGALGAVLLAVGQTLE